MVNILIRTDASTTIGTGHVMRCLTLAKGLKAQGANITFLTQPLSGNLDSKIAEQGFTVCTVDDDTDPQAIIQSFHNTPIDWLIVDHYNLDAAWEGTWRPYVNGIFVIDDLANRPHDCDVLLDQNGYSQGAQRYNGLVPEHCHCLCDPTHALLRSEFTAMADAMVPRQHQVKTILVSFGGADPNQVTLQVLNHLETFPLDGVTVNVVVGPANPDPAALKARTDALGFHYFYNITTMAEMMRDADVFIGAGGTSTWERMALGLPAIIVSIADNHTEISQELADRGYHIHLGTNEQYQSADLHQALQTLMDDADLYRTFSQRSRELVDGHGLERLCAILLKSPQLSSTHASC